MPLLDELEDPVLLPAQFLYEFESTPATRLVAGVLAQALEDLSDESSEHRADAALWLAGGDARVPFEVVAAALRVGPEMLRSAITAGRWEMRGSWSKGENLSQMPK